MNLKNASLGNSQKKKNAADEKVYKQKTEELVLSYVTKQSR
jgi:hypothetical protein